MLSGPTPPSTEQLHNLAVQGPESREILKKIVWTPPTQTSLEELRWFRFTVGRIGKYDGIPIVVSRTGYTGELGYEVWCHPDDGPAVWDAIWDAGQEHGLTPLGLEALDMLRIESGLIFAGYEFDDRVDPFEAGIGFAVDLGTDEDFVGRDALEERKAHPQHVLVGLELESSETAGHGDDVYVGRQRVGVVTSGTRSPILKKNIALCRVAVQYQEPGSKVEVGKLDGLQKRIAATVSSASPSTTPRRPGRAPDRQVFLPGPVGCFRLPDALAGRAADHRVEHLSFRSAPRR
jgi:aminomethyltransferase